MDWLKYPHTKNDISSSTQLHEDIWHAYSGKKDGVDLLFVWLHGWGHTHANLLPLLQQLEDSGDHLIVDFPGFGKSPVPDLSWGTDEYSQHLHSLLQHYTTQYKRIIFVGHSFGCRVSIRYAARYRNDCITAMVLIAGAGLQRKLPFHKKMRRLLIKQLLSTGKKIDSIFSTEFAQKIRQRFGSSDYLNAGVLRPILSRVVSEDLSPLAQAIEIPTLLIYGELDSSTPPEFGYRYHKLMKKSTLHVLPDFDHYTLLTHAKYQVAGLISDWMSDLEKNRHA